MIDTSRSKIMMADACYIGGRYTSPNSCPRKQRIVQMCRGVGTDR